MPHDERSSISRVSAATTGSAPIKLVWAARARPPEPSTLRTRRSLLRGAFWSALGVSGAGLLLGMVNYVWPRHVALAAGEVRVPPEQAPAPGAAPVRFAEGKFWLVNLQPGGGVPEPFRGYAAASERGGLLALSQRCPHLGCSVPWNATFVYEGVQGWFRCPCHASTYTRAGVRVLGPAPRPMDTHPLRVNGDGSVIVDTRRTTPGGPDNPQRAVPATD